ncbi:hypothetical protein QGX12_gp104 [Pseudomonas phage Kremar]|uniref:Uncharacterized protein n=1 Tax=Pseudomonas phage Kremar TaxID=2928831 RepID=A0AAE9GUZ4_9CAUD|nr:hypothetical protein QGX12_gp104 [Pseudomonas phage Kremar]UOL48540.1 hypothetical protein [Pseudomonas phage Kremar]
METINAMDLVSPEDLHKFVQGLLTEHGETAEELAILNVKISIMQAILTDALGLAEPLIATLEKVE